MNGQEISLGSVRDSYTIQNKLFASSSAEAYRAIDLNQGVSVTIWISRGLYPQPSARAQAFLQRLRYLSVQVPPLADISAFGIDGHGTAFLVLPVLDGAVAVTPLREAVEVERRFLRMLKIVDRVHTAGVLCGELCQSSFWLNRSGEISLISAFGPDAGEQHGGGSVLTEDIAEYCAPEILNGGKLSFATDTYALGVIAWQMIYGDTVGLADRLGQGVFELPVKGLAGLAPAWAEEVLRGALRVKPSERFPDAGAMIQALKMAKDNAALSTSLPVKRGQNLLPVHTQARMLVRHRKIIEDGEPSQSNDALPARPLTRFLLPSFLLFLIVATLLYLLLSGNEELESLDSSDRTSVAHDKVEADRPLKETLQEIERDAQTVVDDHEKLKSLIASRDPIAQDSLVRLALSAKNLDSRKRIESAILDRVRLLGLIRAAEETRVWLQTLPEGVPSSYEWILRAIDPTLPQDATEKYLRQAYTSLPALSMRLTAALGYDAKNIDKYHTLISQLIGDSMKLDGARDHSAAALILADPITSQTYADDVIQSIDQIPDSDIQWLLDVLALRRDPNIKVIAHAAIQRNILGSGKKIFAKVLRDRDDVSAQLSVALVNAVAGTLSSADIGEIGNWYDMQSQNILLGILATTIDEAILIEAFDTVASKVKKGELSSLLIDRIRNHYWDSRGRHAHLIGIVAFSDEFTLEQIDEVLAANERLLSDDSKLLDILLTAQEPKLLRAVVKKFPNSLGAGRLINLLSFNDTTLKLIAIEHLKEYNQVQLLQLILEAYQREKEEVVRQAYRDAFWFIRDREAKK